MAKSVMELTFELHSPLTEEDWDKLTDVDFDHSDSVTFNTKHGKTVEFTKVVRCKDCTFGSHVLDKKSGFIVIDCLMLRHTAMPSDGYCCFGHRGMSADEVERCKI